MLKKMLLFVFLAGSMQLVGMDRRPITHYNPHAKIPTFGLNQIITQPEKRFTNQPSKNNPENRQVTQENLALGICAATGTLILCAVTQQDALSLFLKPAATGLFVYTCKSAAAHASYVQRNAEWYS